MGRTNKQISRPPQSQTCWPPTPLPMKQLILILFFCFSAASASGQAHPASTSLMLPEKQNQQWLTTLRYQDKRGQWSMIRERFFRQKPANKDAGEKQLFAPILVIDGILLPITNNLSSKSRDLLLTLLTEDKIKEIAVLDEQPEELFSNKRFTGIIAVVLSDKRTSKKLQKIAIE